MHRATARVSAWRMNSSTEQPGEQGAHMAPEQPTSQRTQTPHETRRQGRAYRNAGKGGCQVILKTLLTETLLYPMCVGELTVPRTRAATENYRATKQICA